DLADFFERMAEHSMSDVMDQCRGHRDMGLMLLKLAIPGQPLLDRGSQLARDVENTHAVRKTRVRRAGIDDLGKSKLLYPPQPLEWPRLDDFPQRVLELIRAELDKVVHRIANSLRLWRKGHNSTRRSDL